MRPDKGGRIPQVTVEMSTAPGLVFSQKPRQVAAGYGLNWLRRSNTTAIQLAFQLIVRSWLVEQDGIALISQVRVIQLVSH
jgi:hypothetical protein